jgi:serine protease
VAPGGDTTRDDTADGLPDGVLQQSFDPWTAVEQQRYDDFGYFFVDGTSQAAPHVSAAAALLMSRGVSSPQAVKAFLEATASDLGPEGRDDEYGHGLVQVDAALTGLGVNR